MKSIGTGLRLLLAALALPLIVVSAPGVRAQEANRRCFPETGECIEGRFLEYWEQNGGLLVFGFPITSAAEEFNFDLGRSFQTQWFERNRFELHPENGRPYDVLLGRLGADHFRETGFSWQSEPKGMQHNGCLWFPETQHSVCDQAAGIGLKSYWQQHGLSFDGRAGYSPPESLALFGLPLTEPRMGTNSSGDTVLTQWFERARFEWHPDKPDQFKVLLGLLGNESSKQIAATQNPGLPGRILILAGPLYDVKADGTRTTRLPFSSLSASFAISQKSGRIAMQCPANGGICTANLDGSDVKRIHNDPFAFVESWSPDDSRLTYVSSNDAAGRRGLHVINADGSGDTLVMAGEPGRMQEGSSWSLDGARIVFNTVFSEHALYVINADGTQLRQIAPEGDNAQWSPDGSKIVFDSVASGNQDIYVINPDGSGRKQLTTSPAAESHPQWSPDGTRIAYHWVGVVEPRPAGAPTGINVMRADGGNNVEALHSQPSYSFGGFVWSPDSNYVAASRACPRLCGPQQTWGAKADGSSQFLMVEAVKPGFPAAVVSWLP